MGLLFPTVLKCTERNLEDADQKKKQKKKNSIACLYSLCLLVFALSGRESLDRDMLYNLKPYSFYFTLPEACSWLKRIAFSATQSGNA